MRVATLVLAAASSAMAHFIIQSPPSRPFDDDGEAVGPCGNQPLGARTAFPITGGAIIGDLFHPTATANFSIVISNTDPTASQFGQVFIAPGMNVALTEGQFDYGPIDLSKVDGAMNGANATIQVLISTVDGILYQCIDVIQTFDSSISAIKTAAITPFSAIADAAGPAANTATATAQASKTAAASSAVASTSSKSGALANVAGVVLAGMMVIFAL
ncbi:hypothetical protein BC830DRAFT_1082476 [Chytriomyces sp. MP71]|nr:hypothetical protein BC830DRAFT_1082476 [Chytriomyces sp. MP71]